MTLNEAMLISAKAALTSSKDGAAVCIHEGVYYGVQAKYSDGKLIGFDVYNTFDRIKNKPNVELSSVLTDLWFQQ